MAGSLVDGPYAPPLTIPNQPVTGNALRLSGSTWQPVLDDGTNAQQGFPFEIDGGLLTTPTLSVSSNKPSLTFGERLTLTATMTPGATPVDAYVLLDLPLPIPTTYSLTLNGIVPGIVPIARGFVPFSFTGVLLDVTLPPIPQGTYGVRSVLTVPGTTVPISLNQTSFTVGTP